MTAVVIADPDIASATAARLGRLTDPSGAARVTLGGVALDRVPVAEVRRRLLVLDRDPHLLVRSSPSWSSLFLGALSA